MLKEAIDAIQPFLDDFPKIKNRIENRVIIVSRKMSDNDFTEIDGNQIKININTLYDRERLMENLRLGELAAKTIDEVVFHELGHIVYTCYYHNVVEIINNAYYAITGNKFENEEQIDVFIESTVSGYSSTKSEIQNGESTTVIYNEFIPELMSLYKRGNEFTKLCTEMIKNTNKRNRRAWRP